MNLFAVYLIILCFCKPKNVQQISTTFSSNLIRILKVGIKESVTVKLAMIILLLMNILSVTTNLIILFYDKKHPRFVEKTFYFWINLVKVNFEFLITVILFWVYKNVIFERNNNQKRTLYLVSIRLGNF